MSGELHFPLTMIDQDVRWKSVRRMLYGSSWLEDYGPGFDIAKEDLRTERALARSECDATYGASGRVAHLWQSFALCASNQEMWQTGYSIVAGVRSGIDKSSKARRLMRRRVQRIPPALVLLATESPRDEWDSTHEVVDTLGGATIGELWEASAYQAIGLWLYAKCGSALSMTDLRSIDWAAKNLDPELGLHVSMDEVLEWFGRRK